MANQVYGPDADEKYAPLHDSETDQNTPSNRGGMDPRRHDTAAHDGSDPRGEDDGDAEEPDRLNTGELQQAESGAAGSNPDRPGSGRAVGSEGLQGAEQSGAAAAATSGNDQDSMYKPDGDDEGRLGAARSKVRNARSKIKGLTNKAFKNKWLVGSIGAASSMIIVLIIVLAVLIGGYKVVDFAEHIAAYQFARTTSQMAENTASINAEKVGLEVAANPDNVSGNRAYNAAKAIATNTKGKISDLWSKFDKYRPAKIIANFKNNGTLQYNEAETKLGTPYVKSVTINGVETRLETKSLSGSLRNTFVPGYKFTKQDFPFARNFAPDLIDELKANNVGPITRAKVASQIRGELNIGLIAWVTGRFAGKSEAAANAELERESTAAAQGKQLTLFADNGGDPATAAKNNTPDTATGASSGIDSAAKDVATAEQQALFDNKTTADIAANPNQTPKLVSDALNKDASAAAVTGLQGFIGSVLRFINPVYKWGVPLCLIYDGSIQQAGKTIDYQSQQAERSAIWVQSAAAQGKDGNATSAEAMGATNWKIDDITNTNAERRASGIPVDTSNYPSTEASATGQYTYTVADYLPGIGNVVDHLSAPVCSALTNVWVGVGLAAVNVGIAVLSGGQASAAEGGGEAAVDGAVNTQLSLFDASSYGTDVAANSGSLLSRMVAKARVGGSIAKDFTKSTAKGIVAVGALTVMARQLVASEMGGSHSPLATGQPYDDTVDCGTNTYANQINQRQFYGAPLTDARLPADDTQNRAQLAAQTSRESAYDRYLAVGNADSLLSRVAMASSGYLNSSILKAPFKIGSSLLNPVRSTASVLNPLTSHSSFAAATITSANTYCGNIQFGFTTYEKQLIANDPAYKPLENQLYLDQSGQEDTIAARYGQCFTESVGTMLQNGDVQRDNTGNVMADKGLCSPRNLGTANNDPGQGPGGKGFHDLVFRWRVAQGYNNTLDQLGQMQDVSNTSSPSSPTTSSVTSGDATTLPSGSAQDLAKELLPFIANDQIYCGPLAGSTEAANCPDIQNTATGTPIGGNCAVNSLTPHLLGLILGLVKTDGWKLGISAMCSDHHPEGDGPYAGHSYGSVADFSAQNGVAGAGAAANKKFVDDAAALLSSTGGSFGQIECSPTSAHASVVNNSKFTTFSDSCTHQHIRAAP